MDLHFYQCEICGKIIAVISGDDVPTVCCGEAMKALPLNRTDGAKEKHVPVFRSVGGTVHVKIGSLPHPMTEYHSIVWIAVMSSHGFLFRQLHPGDKPEACFKLCSGESVKKVYALCDVHGLWFSDKESDV